MTASDSRNSSYSYTLRSVIVTIKCIVMHTHKCYTSILYGCIDSSWVWRGLWKSLLADMQGNDFIKHAIIMLQ